VENNFVIKAEYVQTSLCIERASSDEKHNVAYKSIDCTGQE